MVQIQLKFLIGFTVFFFVGGLILFIIGHFAHFPTFRNLGMIFMVGFVVYLARTIRMIIFLRKHRK